MAAAATGNFIMDAEFDLALTAGREEADEFLFRLRMRSSLHGQEIHHTIGAGVWLGAKLLILNKH